MIDPLDADPDRGSAASAPRWVKVLGLIGIIVVVVIVVLELAGVGDHGPQRHVPAVDTSQVEKVQAQAVRA